MPIERDELWSTLMQLHREVIKPDIEAAINGAIRPLRDEMNSHFDATYKRLDNIDSEIATLHGAVRRLDDRMDALEKRMAALEQKITNAADKGELDALRSRLDELETELTALKQRLAEMESRAAEAQPLNSSKAQ